MPANRKLGKTTDQRMAMLRQQVTDFLDKGRMETTVTRAKEIAPLAEKMITLAKDGGLDNYRQALSFFTREDIAKRTFDELSAHVDHWLSLGGEDHIALGTDRDGADIPTWLADCSAHQALYDRFEERFGQDVTRKLFYENALRFFSSIS